MQCIGVMKKGATEKAEKVPEMHWQVENSGQAKGYRDKEVWLH